MPASAPPWRRVVNALVGVVLLVVLVALCWQIYRVSTGQVAVYGQRQAPASMQTPRRMPVTGQPHYASTPQVQQIIGAQPVPPKQLGATAQSVTFRSKSGFVACMISRDLAKPDPSGFVPPIADRQGRPAAGAGVVCATLHNIRVHDGDGRRCQDAVFRPATFGVWGKTTGVGSCLPDLAPLHADARQHAEGGDRFKLPVLGYGQHVELGDYGCIISGAVATCANLRDGRGFTVEDNVGYQFFGPGTR